MEERYEEGLIKGSIDSMTIDKIDIITDQMKKYIYKIIGNKIGTGFFCKILYKDKLIPVMITNYHIINDNYLENNEQIEICINNDSKLIDINKKNKIYSSDENEYDIMIIKIKENIINNYLEIYNNIYQYNSEKLYKNKSIYITLSRL